MTSKSGTAEAAADQVVEVGEASVVTLFGRAATAELAAVGE